MIVTSDRTALIAIMIDANTGSSRRTRLVSASDGMPRRRLPASRPNPTKSSTGSTTVPTAPSGSRKKILTSSEVSFNKPRPIDALLADRMAGHGEEDILERRQHRAEVGDPEAVLGQSGDDVGDEVLAAAADDHAAVLARHRIDAGDLLEPVVGAGIDCRQFDAALRTVPRDQPRRRVDIDDAAVIDDCDAVA